MGIQSDIKDAQPVAWGNFLTVWKRQPDKSWKFAIDLGISNPKPDQVAAPLQLAKQRSILPDFEGRDKPDASGLLARDREFSAASSARGAQIAFGDYAAKDVRLFRNGQQPAIGKANAIAAVVAVTSSWTWEPAFADVSGTLDLGYTYGTYKLVKNDANGKPESGNYFEFGKKSRAL